MYLFETHDLYISGSTQTAPAYSTLYYTHRLYIHTIHIMCNSQVSEIIPLHTYNIHNNIIIIHT